MTHSRKVRKPGLDGFCAISLYIVTQDSVWYPGRRALVIGGSLAGLFAARVLTDSFDTVTIVDRDLFPAAPDHRKGVPQSYHAHGLLATAFPILEQLFPGPRVAQRADPGKKPVSK